MGNRKSIFANIDIISILIYLALVAIGILTIYSTEYKLGTSFTFSPSSNYGKQIIFLGVSLFVAMIILIIDAKFYANFAWIIYFIVILLLIAVLIFGKSVKGANSWFDLGGGLRFQPAEFGKLAACIALAKYLGTIDVKFSQWKTKLISMAIIFAPMILILAQNDTGSALVFFCFVFVLYREGLPEWVFWGGLVLIVISVLALLVNKYILIGSLLLLTILFWILFRKQITRSLIAYTLGIFLFLSSAVMGIDFFVNHVLQAHQRNRINVILGKVEESDMKTIAYNLYQSKIAIGAGGLLGRGYLQGVQTRGNFVPEMSTDFIFSSFGEEWGFVGSLVLIGLYLLLFLRILKRSEEQRSIFGRVYGYGVASIFFFHFMVNIGMTIGLLPVIGIPLPFISYGGSSLLAFTILYFIFIKIDSEKHTILR